MLLRDIPSQSRLKRSGELRLRSFTNHKPYPELRMALQDQADRALRHFVYGGDLLCRLLAIQTSRDLSQTMCRLDRQYTATETPLCLSPLITKRIKESNACSVELIAH
jgi:hypothetical protein